MLIKAYSGVNLARGSSGLAYPYNTGVVNVTSSEWGGTTTSTNYFFYNLQYGTICFLGARTPVVATVNTAPAITLSLASPASTCDNVPLNNVTALGTGYTNYAWSPAGTVTNNVADGSDVNLAPTTGTTYSIVATGGGCTNTATLVVNVSNAPNAPTITLSPSATTICDGDIVNLTASGSSALTTPSLATVGTGTVVPGTLSYPNPLSAYYGGVKHQMIYTVAELTGQGMPAIRTTIKSIALNVSAFDKCM